MQFYNLATSVELCFISCPNIPILFRIDRQNEMISNAHRTVSETEEVGMEITAELARNREKIEASRAKVRANA